jgi:hypothetical protein
MKLQEMFSEVYNKSHLTESATIEELNNGWKAKFKKSDEKDFYDLLLKSPGGEKYIIRKAAYYTTGYDQGIGVGNKQKYYINTVFGINAGNGGGVSTKSTPIIRYVKYLSKALEEVTDNIDNGIFEGKSSFGNWEVEPI